MGCRVEGWGRICFRAATSQGDGSRWQGRDAPGNGLSHPFVVFIVVPLQVDVKKTALALAITDSELSDEEASILESGGFSVSRATTPQLTDVSEGMGSPLSFLIFLFPVLGC